MKTFFDEFDRRRAGFSLVELLVVLAMIAVITAAMTVSVNRARTRAMVAKATQEVKEMTNAILAYEQYAKGYTLEKEVTGSWVDCTEGSMKMILGGVTGENGNQVPILYNASVKQGELRDPWGNAYQYMIAPGQSLDGDQSTGAAGVDYKTAPALPNFFRLTDEERGR